MTTLAEARDRIHVLTARRMRFLTRRDAGELVDKFRAASAATSMARGFRDRILDFPVRYAAVMAAELGVSTRASFMTLSTPFCVCSAARSPVRLLPMRNR